MRHYFKEVSYDMLDAPTTHFPLANGETIISYQDDYPRNYYEPYNAQSNPDGYTNDRTEREHTLLRKAIEFIEDEVPLDLIIDGDNDNISYNTSSGTVLMPLETSPTASIVVHITPDNGISGATNVIFD